MAARGAGGGSGSSPTPASSHLQKAFVFMELTPEKSEECTRAFEKAIGN